MERLRLVFAENTDKKAPAVFYDYRIRGKRVIIDFLVESSEIFADPYRPKDRSSFGLWMMDVVEFFGRTEGNKTYYEFQVSPFNQFFELEIIKPMKSINLKFKSGFKHEAIINGKGKFKVRMDIPLRKLSSKRADVSRKIEGNFFACLGKPFERFFYSAFLPVSRKHPNFHRPAHFKTLYKE